MTVEMINLISLKDTTKGEDIFHAVETYNTNYDVKIHA